MTAIDTNTKNHTIDIDTIIYGLDTESQESMREILKYRQAIKSIGITTVLNCASNGSMKEFTLKGVDTSSNAYSTSESNISIAMCNDLKILLSKIVELHRRFFNLNFVAYLGHL